MKPGSYKSIYPIAVLALLLLAGSCRNKIEDIQALNYRDTFPLESARDVEMIYSDSAEVKAMVRSPLVNRYGGEDPYLVLPEGVKVYFYDSVLNVKTRLSAGYAIKHERSQLMEARYDVVVINSAGEKLNTEHLVWDQSRKIIFSDVFVKITRKDEVIYGQGLEADESFDKWVIKKPKGTFYISMEDQKNQDEEIPDPNQP